MKKNFLSINIPKLPVFTTEEGIDILKKNINKLMVNIFLLLNNDPEAVEEIQLELEEKIKVADEHDVIFMVRLSDQRRFIAETDDTTFHKIKKSMKESVRQESSTVANSA